MTISTMGPLPAVSGCACHICLPDPPVREHLDDGDRSCIETVVRCGWQVILVGGDCSCSNCGKEPDAADDGPAFAYTVGLMHRAGHPELAMTGLAPAVMHHALNVVADRVVRHGLQVQPGDVIETVLLNAPVVVDEVSAAGLQHIGSWSAWFHRTSVPALQLVWPTTSGVFAWQPGALPELDELQPVPWRVPRLRSGALGIDPAWPLPTDPDTTVIVCTHMRHENEPIRFVARTHDAEGVERWDFHCGRDHGDGIDQLLTEHVAHTVRAAPSLREIADLAVGEFAERDDAFSPWRRGMLP
jgi:Domain of unknown function (DUF4262)